MRISDWISDVCSADLGRGRVAGSLPAASVPSGQLRADREHGARWDLPLPLPAGPLSLPGGDGVPVGRLRSALGAAHDAVATGAPELRTGRFRSEERRIGKASVSTCRSRWSTGN